MCPHDPVNELFISSTHSSHRGFEHFRIAPNALSVALSLDSVKNIQKAPFEITGAEKSKENNEKQVNWMKNVSDGKERTIVSSRLC